MSPAGKVSAILAAGALACAAGRAWGVLSPLGIPGGAIALGLAPGLGLALLLAPGERLWLSVCRGLALSPVVSGIGAVALLAAGVAPEPAAMILVTAGTLFALVVVAGSGKGPWGVPLPRWERRMTIWLLVLAVLVLVPHALREWVRVRSDAVFHTAVALEIAHHGVPPQDPYFAGMKLNYIWVYHALLAVWSSMAGVRAWDLGGVMNALWLVSLGGGVYALSRRARRPRRESFFASVFVPLGLSALFYAWFPLKLARALVGETAGWGEAARVFSLSPFGFDQAWHFSSFLGSPPAFLNKYLVMTAFSGGVTSLVWVFEGLAGKVRSVRSLKDPTGRAWAAHRQRAGFPLVVSRSVRWMPLTALAVLGTWLWHPPLAVAGALGGALAGGWFLVRPAPVGRGPVVRGAIAYGLGTAAAVPFLLASVGRAEGRFPLGFSPAVPAIVVGSTAALLLGAPALRRLRSPASALLVRVLAVATAAASLVIVLPPPNSQDKMPFAFYLLLGTAAGWTLGRWWGALARRRRTWLAWILSLAILLPISALCYAAYLFEPAKPGPDAAARELYRWIRTETEPDAVFVDTPERVEVLVRGERRLYYGRKRYAELWRYPAAEMEERESVREKLTGDAGNGTGVPDALDAFRARTGDPVYVIWRAEDHPRRPAGESVMGRNPDRFRRVWEREGTAVFRLLEAE